MKRNYRVKMLQLKMEHIIDLLDMEEKYDAIINKLQQDDVTRCFSYTANACGDNKKSR